jgi:hypothetical protein
MSFRKYLSTLNTAGTYLGRSAYKAMPIAAILSTIASIECTLDSHLHSFTQIRIQIWNPLLCYCLGAASSFIRCFDSLALTLINWLSGWNCRYTERPGLSVLHDRSKVNVSARQRYSIKSYLKNQQLIAKSLPSHSSPTNPSGLDGSL